MSVHINVANLILNCGHVLSVNSFTAQVSTVGWQNKRSLDSCRPQGLLSGQFCSISHGRVSGKRFDVNPILMDAGDGCPAASLVSNRSPSVCLMSDERRCCAVATLNHVSQRNNSDANEVKHRYRDTATHSITSQITAQSSNLGLCT